jgi:16S rRNA (cytidine1402-2'-O)-methyltransferase
VKLLEDLVALEPDRRLVVGREMTKVHEEYLEGTAKEMAATLGSRAQIKGEVTVLVGPRKKG